MRTVEEKKRLLREYATIGRDLEAIREQKARLKSFAEKITAGFDNKEGISRGKTSDKVQDYVEKLDALEEKYEKLCEEKVKLCELVDTALMKLPQIERYVLIERFIVGTPAWKVGRFISYCERSVYEIEKTGLKNFDV